VQALSAAKAVEEEKLAEEKRITDAKKKYKLFLQANEVERAKKEKLAEKEAEDDYQRMLAYMELMDKQQAAREAVRVHWQPSYHLPSWFDCLACALTRVIMVVLMLLRLVASTVLCGVPREDEAQV